MIIERLVEVIMGGIWGSLRCLYVLGYDPESEE